MPPQLAILHTKAPCPKTRETITTNPFIVTKVGLKSHPPPARDTKASKSFNEVTAYIIERESPLALFRGAGPRFVNGLIVEDLIIEGLIVEDLIVEDLIVEDLIVEDLIVESLLVMIKERMDFLFVVLFTHARASKRRQ
jgi:Mitochondrial carrier protein